MAALTKVTEHVYWMPPGPPDRPSLCAVVGDRRTIMLDAGSSPAHTASFLRALAAEGVARPSAVVYTHSDWDHVVGGVEVGALVIAHALTAERLLEMARWDWSDEGLDRRVALGLASPRFVADVKAELPSPRAVGVAPADVVFRDGLDVDLGGATVCVRHVGGDHSPDSSVMFVEPDRLLFLGDCLAASPQGTLTAGAAFGVRDTVLAFDAAHYVEGHHEALASRSELEELFGKLELAERAARGGPAVVDPDEDTAYFLRAFEAGRD